MWSATFDARNSPVRFGGRGEAFLRPYPYLRLTVSAKVAFSDRTVEQASGLCREGWEGLSRRVSVMFCILSHTVLDELQFHLHMPRLFRTDSVNLKDACR